MTPGTAEGRQPATGVVILLRHGRSVANNDGVLAGQAPGVELDATGRRQADALVERFAGAHLARIVTSPMLRCRRTVAPLADSRGLPVEIDEAIGEVDYGSWTGRRLADLAAEPLWRTVQAQPSAAAFPGGEALMSVSSRAVAAARGYGAAGGTGATVLCTHGDVIKAILADALGMHLDQFQRIAVGPASVSVIRYAPLRPLVERMGETGSLHGVGLPPQQPANAGHPVIPGAGGAASGTDAGEAPIGGDPGLPAP